MANTVNAFLKAIKKAFEYMDTHSELEIAECIVKQFPSTTITSIETSVKSYKNIDAWKSDLIATEESFTRLQNIMIEAKELDAKVDFSKLVDNSFAQKIA